MSESTRRGFLITAGAGAAVAAAAATGVVASRSGESVPAASSVTTLPKHVSGPLVAYVHDVRAGQISVMVGESEVVVTDRDLVGRLLAARTRS